MYIPPPPEHPDVHLRHERNRRQQAEREANSGHPGKGRLGLSAGDKIIFLVLGVIVLAGGWFFLSWLLAG